MADDAELITEIECGARLIVAAMLRNPELSAILNPRPGRDATHEKRSGDEPVPGR